MIVLSRGLTDLNSTRLRCCLGLFVLLSCSPACNRDPNETAAESERSELMEITTGGASTLAINGGQEIFRDNFSGSTLNSTKWQTDLTGIPGVQCPTLFNSQYSNFTDPADVIVGQGVLALRARANAQTRLCPNYNVSRPYTAGFITTKGQWATQNFGYTYGYAEMRAKFPAGIAGAWPAFWSLVSAQKWGPEFDFPEYYGYQGGTYDNILNNLMPTVWPTVKWVSHKTTGGFDFGAWHAYGLEWGIGYARFLIDDEVLATVADDPSSNPAYLIPDTKMYLLLNNGVNNIGLSKGPWVDNQMLVDFVSVRKLLVANAEAERDPAPSWTSWGAAAQDCKQAHAGRCSLLVGALTAPVAGAFEQVVKGLTPNAKYILRAWSKSASGAPIRIGVKNYGAADTSEGNTSTAWTPVGIEFTVGANSSQATIYCFAPGGIGSCDSFSISRSAGILVANADFEDELTDWKIWNQAASDATTVRLGAHSVRVGSQQSYGSVEQQISGLKPGASYQLSAWAQNADDGTTRIGVKGYSGPELWSSIVGSTWKNGIVTATLGPNDSSLTIYCYSTQGRGYCDSMVLTPIPFEAIKNPGFEAGIANWKLWNAKRDLLTPKYGTASIKVGSSTGAGSAEQLVTDLRPGATYTLSGVAKADSGGRIHLGAKNFGGAESMIPIEATAWTNTTVTFTLAADKNEATIYCYAPRGSGNCDGLTLTRVP